MQTAVTVCSYLLEEKLPPAAEAAVADTRSRIGNACRRMSTVSVKAQDNNGLRPKNNAMPKRTLAGCSQGRRQQCLSETKRHLGVRLVCSVAIL